MTAMARLTALLFAMWVGVTVGQVVDLEKRVIGGHVCEPNERLYHVRLIFTNRVNMSFCGGSLISKQWILTAAHCFEKGWEIFAHIRVHPGPHEEVQIRHPHEIFNDGQQHDLMLLKLPEAVVGITPIPLPDCKNPPKKGAKVQIAGHASTTAGPNNERQPGYSATLQCADMNIVGCQTHIGNMRLGDPLFYANHGHEHWICTHSPPVDACCGDSGGGVVYKNKIYGVISHGNRRLVAGSPLASSDLCYGPYNQWIRNTIAQP